MTASAVTNGTGLEPRADEEDHLNHAARLLDHVALDHRTRSEEWAELATDVLQGLATTPKTLPPRWLYDARGSELFDAITDLPEYYPYRCEELLLASAGEAIIEAIQPTELVELGSGFSRKTRLLLDPMLDREHICSYVPVDVSRDGLAAGTEAIRRRYPGLEVRPVACDFMKALPPLEHDLQGPRVMVLLGGTVGNMAPSELHMFLRRVVRVLRPGDGLLVGFDLVKDVGTIQAAYNDARGVTAEFNLNVLAVINRVLSANFVLDNFAHEARFNHDLQRIEMRLRSKLAQIVTIPALGLEVPFQAGESILTEISRKFSRSDVESAYAAGGLRTLRWLPDEEHSYALSLAGLVSESV